MVNGDNNSSATAVFEYNVATVGTDGSEAGRAGVGYTKAISGSEFASGTNVSYTIGADGKQTITFKELEK